MHIHLDPLGGLAGNMFVAALLDAFPGLEAVAQRAVRAAGLPDRFSCDLVKHTDHSLSGKRFLVREAAPFRGPLGDHAHHHPHHPEMRHDHDHAQEHDRALDHTRDHEHGHRPFAAIRSDLVEGPLEPGVRDQALAIFEALAEAEAQVHGATLDTVTFHEVGAWDSIADIVAAASIIHALSPATWSIGALPLGSGFVKSAHGLLPVPAPATVLLLRGLAVRDDGVSGERVTPTGAAIAKHLSSRPGTAPRERTILGSGLGFGTRTLPGMSNSLRALIFDAAAASRPEGEAPGRVTSIEFEVDDQTPEDLAIGLDHLRAHGSVLDVLQTPAFGKKGRVAVCVRVLCRPEAEAEVAALCFHETSTLGLRLHDVRRLTLARSIETIDVGDLTVQSKRARRGDHSTEKVEAESLREVKGRHERDRLRRAAQK